ncbi:MAG: SAM-dependent methyltransferase [Acidobacteria bacterium]|nr:SAM-dependent methyltransferase [Acidobacteriota bacterium]
MQHIRSMLKIGGSAAAVLPDNVLFEGGSGEVIRRTLLRECDVHAILRLPTGIFYAHGVKANVLFFERRAPTAEPATSELWVFDLRTNQRFTLKTRPLRRADLEQFVKAYKPGRPRSERVENEQFKRWSRSALEERPGLNLDVWANVKDESSRDPSQLDPPVVIAQQIVENVRAGLDSFIEVALELGKLTGRDEDERGEDALQALLNHE